MEPCPFCNTNVDSDLLQFGGTCPSCFGEIPGEEAATDPGEAVKAQQVKEDEARAKKKMLVPMLGLVGVIGIVAVAVCGLAWQSVNTATEVAIDAALADVQDEVTVDPDAPKQGEGRLVVDPVAIEGSDGEVGYLNPRTGEVVEPDEDGNVVIVDEVAQIKRVINATTGDTKVYDLESGEEALVDRAKGLAVVRDEETGTARIVDPRTGITTIVDEKSGKTTTVINPMTGERQTVSQSTGFIVVEDERTGVTAVVDASTGVVAEVDERTGAAKVVNPEDGSAVLYNPETEQVAEVNQFTGTATFVDEESGKSVVIDPNSGATAELDENTGSATLINPRTGQSTIVNPEAGTVARIDPLTGTAVTVAPQVEASAEELDGIAAAPDGRLPSAEEVDDLPDGDEAALPGSRFRTRAEIAENIQVTDFGSAPDAGLGTTSGTRMGSGLRSGSGSSGGLRDASVKVDASTDVTTTKASQYTVLGLTPDVSISRREQLGIRLEDDRAIIEMIKRVMDTEIPRLRVCYERRLKQEPDLRGRWALIFTVQADGYTRDNSVTGLDGGDAQLEACLVEKLKSWQFQRIREDQPIRKTVTFRPS